ncbi:RagB/SusD family nutrient uptake outer membrane protein [Flavobacterium sp.]|uniref:RagB/SusD family nutrient uptake outer membrane protein n=1 Tax=Flavobacterium sp. TaxID=239 RepID=UPI003750AA0C
MKRNLLIKSILFASTLLLSVSCTDLKEESLDGVIIETDGGGTVNTSAILQSAYNGLREFQAQGQMFAMDEMSTDALVGPTRGGDWDDGGAWRQLHTHTWAPDHGEVRGAWNSLLSNVYNCNLVIENSSNASEILQARFLRAFYYYNVVDLFGQAPYREAGSELEADPLIWTRSEATAYVISELEAIVGTLPARVAGDPSIANSDAAHFLLAKIYLNKGVFDSAAPEGPYTFDNADLTKVVTHVDAMSNSLSTNYWDNFSPSNSSSDELVFSSKNVAGNGGNIQSRWRMSSHYNQTPGGWNGFATVAEYYNKFNAADSRINNTSPYMINNFGNPAGFQIGQQYAPGGVTPLQDRNGNALSFTSALTIITNGVTLETAGIRGMKYMPDTANLDAPNNDYVLMRYSDALLMKAEAITRGGTGAIGTIMADIAARTGQPAAPATLDGIYAERGRELWWEGYRRNDMIRFGTFLNQRGLKPYVSAAKYALYPIPADALFNANLSQNPGY